MCRSETESKGKRKPQPYLKCLMFLNKENELIFYLHDRNLTKLYLRCAYCISRCDKDIYQKNTLEGGARPSISKASH